MSLRSKTIAGIKWTSLSAVLIAFLQIAQISIVSRFLSLADFGLMSILMIVIGFSQSFIDMGISNAIIHKQEISHVQLSTLYWLSLLIGFLFFLILLMISPYIANFYSEPRLAELLPLLSLTFLIQPLGQQFMVILQKNLQFSNIARIDVLSKFVSLVTSSILAWKGLGVTSLIGGTLFSTAVQALLFMYDGWKYCRPSFVFQIREVKDFLNFGLYQTAERTINYFNLQIDSILIGKILGVEELGLYTIAKQLVMKPAQVFNPIISRVTFPAMSKIQNDICKIRDVYLKTIHYLSLVNFPIYAFIFLYASEILDLLFGPEWIHGANILRILSVWGAIRSTGNPVGSLLLARGEVKRGFIWNLCLFLYTPLGIYIGSQWGVSGISFALLIMAFPLNFVLNWYFLVNPLCGVNFFKYSREVLRPLLITVFTMTIVFIFNYSLDIESILFRVLFGGILGGGVLSVLCYYFEGDFIKTFRELLRC